MHSRPPILSFTVMMGMCSNVHYSVLDSVVLSSYRKVHLVSINPLSVFTGQITASDMNRVAHRLLKSRLSLAALGTLDRLPELETVQGMLTVDTSSTSKLFQFGSG